MKRTLLLLLVFCAVYAVQGQVYNEMNADGQITQRNEYGTNSNFNPNKHDSVSSEKEVPIGIRLWTVDRRFGDVIPSKGDTLTHLYQNTIYDTGIYGHYNTLGTNYTARQSRIFMDRPLTSEFFFIQPYSFTIKEPEDFLFVNTLSPYTRINYETCGDKQNGEDHIDAKFGVNVNKRFGIGFDLDYHYALGYYDNHNNACFRSSIFSSYIGDRYQMHLLGSLYHRKAGENGGIVNDLYITHPESEESTFSENEIPTVLRQNWNRNNTQHLFFSQRYNIGFYRYTKLTDEEIKARQFAKKAAEQKDQKGPMGNLKGTGKGPAMRTPIGRPDNARIMGDEPASKKDQELVDSTRIKVDSQEKMDSLLAIQARQDSIDETMKKEYVPVTSLIHTLDLNNYNRIYQAYSSPADYYADTFYDLNDENQFSGDSIFDRTKYFSVKNTFAIALLEGFNKYMKAGLKAFISHEYRKYQMPDLVDDATAYYMNQWTEQNINIGGQILKRQGNTLHFNLAAELGLTGHDQGKIAVDFDTDLNFPLFGDTLQLAAKAYFYRKPPTFFQETFHSKHFWWDGELEKETRARVEGNLSYQKTNTRLRVAVEEIKNYTYFGMNYNVDPSTYGRSGLTAGVYQESGNINVLTAQLSQHFRLGVLNWENVITYQNSSNQEVLPLPKLNIFTNLYLGFRIARVLDVELGGCCTYFTKYDAPDFVPMLNQFAVQRNADSRVELGGYPFVDVYANMKLKRVRFYVAMSHVNAGSGNRNQFLTPHYPTNNSIFRFGVSWSFFN